MCIILKFSLLMEQFFVHNIIILSYILNFTQANCLELSLFTPNCFGLFLFIPFNLTVCQNSCKCQTNISPISFRRNNYHYFCSTLSSYTVSQCYLGEVAHKMAALPVYFCQYIKHEGFHIKVQSLVIQKQLCQ